MASVGGVASQDQGKIGVRFDSARGREAGRKGGARAAELGTLNRFTPEKAQEAAARSVEARKARGLKPFQRKDGLPTAGDPRDKNTDTLD